MHKSLPAAMFLLLMLAGPLAGPLAAQASKAEIAEGRALARDNCSECHAIGATGQGRAKRAPNFRTLAKRYKLDNLQEAFAEGIAVGHRGVDMPEFQFAPDETDALISYIKSLQK